MVGENGALSFSTISQHPRGLWVLAMTEIWERFSFYGVRALLVLYLSNGFLEHEQFRRVAGHRFVYYRFGRPQGEADIYALASAINEWYSGMAYVTPLLGGWVADRYLGTRRTCILGGVMMMAAHVSMAFDKFFLLGLVLLVLGNGAFKPTLSAQLSQLYEQPDLAMLREGGFALYFVAINLGAFFAPLACGYLQKMVSYHAAFGAAGVGMFIGLIFYVSQLRHLPRDKERGGGLMKAHASDADLKVRPDPPGSPLERGDQPPVPWASPNGPPGTDSKEASHKLRESNGISWPADGRWPARRFVALTTICFLVLPYWVCWEQMANMVPLYYDTSVDRAVFGDEIPAAALQALSPIFTVLLLPFFSARWARQAKSGSEQSTAVKLSIGAAFNGLCWLVFALTADWTHVSDPAHGSTKCSLFWPVLGNLLYTIGHIHVGPVGLSLVTRCAPPGSEALAVGLWYFFGGVSGPVAGMFGGFYALWTPVWFFGGLAALAMTSSLIFITLTGRLERIARGHDISE